MYFLHLITKETSVKIAFKMIRIFSILLLFLATTGLSQENSGLKLWYKQPSGETWENALPIGNGRLGAMIYGNVETETIQLNEHTVCAIIILKFI